MPQFTEYNTDGYSLEQLEELNEIFDYEVGFLDEDDPDFEDKAKALAEAVELAYDVNPRVESIFPSRCGVAGWDVELTVCGDPVEVTLIPHSFSGRPSKWGDLDNWLDNATVKRLEPLGHSKIEFLNIVEHVASQAILKSGIEPSKDPLEDKD